MKLNYDHQDESGQNSSRKHSMLRSKIIASYIIPSRRHSSVVSSPHIVQFLHTIYTQLTETSAVTRFKHQTDNSWLREAVDDPDEVFKKIILFPLLECEAQHKVVILLVDGLDLDIINQGAAATGEVTNQSKTFLKKIDQSQLSIQYLKSIK